MIEACVHKILGYFEESTLDQFTSDLRQNTSGFDDFVQSIPEYSEATTRQRLDVELKLFAVLKNNASLNSRDINRAGAIFSSLYALNSSEETASVTLEFLATISMLCVKNDGETVFSLKSRDAPH